MRGVLLLSRWDYDLVVRAISDLCLHTKGETWEEVATSLSRYGHWEFEDYRA
jgi:Immunity protein 8